MKDWLWQNNIHIFIQTKIIIMYLLIFIAIIILFAINENIRKIQK